MTELLQEAFTIATKLSPEKQDALARLILQEIEEQKLHPSIKKPRPLQPLTKGSGYTDTSINHDAILAESILKKKLPQ